MTKTKGQIDYEKDLKKNPFYHDGTKRFTWSQLDDHCKGSWERPARDEKERLDEMGSGDWDKI